MGITKLMHMKESPKCAHAHLRNAINYILDVKHDGEKTEGGIWVGGNAGTNHKEILYNFLETKNEFGKLYGRQGYHFVISFAPGETDISTVYEVAKEFCERYLGEDYDYVFAVHNDKPHLHAHVIFNSVDRINGRKYHYKKGDWKKDIQPVTDEVCKLLGLNPLKVGEKRVGKSYAEWTAKKNDTLIGRDIIRADIDYTIQQAKSFEEFLDILKKMGYQIRAGESVKHGEYLSFHLPGAGRARRSYKLGVGYSLADIKARIKSKSGSKYYEEITLKLSERVAASGFLKPVTVQKSTRTFRRMYQAVSYYKLPNPYAVPQYQVRKDMLRINNLIAECTYLRQHQISSESDLKKKILELEERQRFLEAERKTLYGIRKNWTEEEKEMISRYLKVKQEYDQLIENGDDRFEELEDELLELEAMFPEGMLETEKKINDCTLQLRMLKKELRMVKRILKTEDDKKPLRGAEPTIRRM